MNKLSTLKSEVQQFRASHPDPIKFPLPWIIKNKILALLSSHRLSDLATELKIPATTICSWKRASKEQSQIIKSPRGRPPINTLNIVPLGTLESLVRQVPKAEKYEFEIEASGSKAVKFRFDRNDSTLLELFFRSVVSGL